MRKGEFYTNFSIPAPEVLIFPKAKAEVLMVLSLSYEICEGVRLCPCGKDKMLMIVVPLFMAGAPFEHSFHFLPESRIFFVPAPAFCLVL